MLELEQVGYTYSARSAGGIRALQGISLRFDPGEMVAVIGHNGSGKSTLAKLLCGSLLPDEGTITVDGLLLTAKTVWQVRRLVQMVFQNPDDQLVANTVIDDVAFGPENLGIPRAALVTQVQSALDALELTPFTHFPLQELASGQKQRVAIAGVLAMQPRYLVMDEPTTMLSHTAGLQVLAIARDLNRRQGICTIHITHFMHELVFFDRLVVMDKGQVVMNGTPREVLSRAAELRVIGLDVPVVTELATRLRAKGWPLPETVLTIEELEQALCS